MAKKTNRKQRDLSIRLKTSFAIQVHLNELLILKRTAEEVGLTAEESRVFIDLMEATLLESIEIIFPKPFEA